MSINVFQRHKIIAVLSAALLSIIDLSLFARWTLAQTSFSLPKPKTSEQRQPITTPITPKQPFSIFDRDNPPPEGYSPSEYKENIPSQFDRYRLDINDGISISVPEFPEFTTVTTIDAEGNIIIPILGRIAVRGLTTTEVEQKIAYELSTRYVQTPPKVSVALNAPRPAEITVLGEVFKPGFYALVPNSPITAALLSAGGSTNNADLRSVILRRSLIDGTVIEEKVDLYTPLIKGKSLPEVRLQGGDTIVISKLENSKDRDYDRSLVARTTLPQQTITIRVLVPASTGTAFRNLTLPNGSTFLDVIASLPEDDRLLIDDEVALFRFNSDRGKVTSQKLKTRATIEGDIAQNVQLQDEDVIVVSRTLLGKVFNAFNIVTQPISSFLGFRAFFEGLFQN